MSRIRVEEQFAAACVEAALPGIVVYHHDNNVRSSAYDFDLASGSKIVAAMEVTSVTDGDAVALYKRLVDAGPFTFPGLSGGWIVSVQPGVDTRPLLSKVEDVLTELESVGIDRFRPNAQSHDPLMTLAYSLGIRSAFRSRGRSAGSVRFLPWYPIDRSAGFVRPDGNALSDWLGDWLRDPACADNLDKLRRSGMGERHLFILLPLLPLAPFEVFDVFLEGSAPDCDPVLPPDVTHVWAASDRANVAGWRWSPGEGWSRFEPEQPYSGPLPVCTCP
jgi:hypothetical protein